MPHDTFSKQATICELYISLKRKYYTLMVLSRIFVNVQAENKIKESIIVFKKFFTKRNLIIYSRLGGKKMCQVVSV